MRAGERPRRGLRLVASSGHELHHLGLEAYLESLGDGVTEVAAWVHLGASIGAKRGTARLAASDAELMGLAQSALAAAGIEREALAVGRSGYGEARISRRWAGVTFRCWAVIRIFTARWIRLSVRWMRIWRCVMWMRWSGSRAHFSPEAQRPPASPTVMLRDRCRSCISHGRTQAFVFAPSRCLPELAARRKGILGG